MLFHGSLEAPQILSMRSMGAKLVHPQATDDPPQPGGPSNKKHYCPMSQAICFSFAFHYNFRFDWILPGLFVVPGYIESVLCVRMFSSLDLNGEPKLAEFSFWRNPGCDIWVLYEIVFAPLATT